jgi:hypothetical protein
VRARTLAWASGIPAAKWSNRSRAIARALTSRIGAARHAVVPLPSAASLRGLDVAAITARPSLLRPSRLGASDRLAGMPPDPLKSAQRLNASWALRNPGC